MSISVFCTVVWGRLGMGRGVVRPWWVTVTVTPASCLFISCAPHCLLYSAPWLPDDNSSALTRQPGWVFTGNYVTGTGKTISLKPLRPAAAQLDSYQYDPVPLLTNAVCKSTGVNSLRCYCSVSSMHWIVVQLYRDGKKQLIGTSWFYCKIGVKYSYIISLRVWTKNRFLEDVIEPTIKPRVSPLSVSKGTGVSRATGPHTLLTASLVGVTSKWGAASLPLTIISLATLPCWCWWRPWTNTAIWI